MEMILVSCKTSNDEELFNLNDDLTVKEISSHGYNKVPVDVNMFEKTFNDSLTIQLTFDDNLDRLILKTWVLHFKNKILKENNLIYTVNELGFVFVSPPCRHDSKYSYFSLIDSSNRVFVGRLNHGRNSVLELSYYFAKDSF